MILGFAEYIWLDGNNPTQTLRSKNRVIELEEETFDPAAFPEWAFDGSSTLQATGDSSDCILKPVSVVFDPIKGEGNFLVMCEVYEHNKPHKSNYRAQLRKVLDAGADKHEAYAGFEQEYTLYSGSTPAGWPADAYPAPQGPYYCGVGTDRIAGRELVDAHAQACLDAGIMICGTNAEVMLGQWEFCIGYRGLEHDDNNILSACDHLHLGRWLLHRLGEEYGLTANFDNKPVKGDWNGAGCHTNISTKATRDPKTGLKAIKEAISKLEKKHTEHIKVYGDKNDERLTGDHETCSIHEFKAGNSDRGASIRIPLGVNQKGYGYFEDRRPGSNIDPYLVAARILTTICDIDENVFTVGKKLKKVTA
ncbi:glutamine synthetase [Candidatus Marinamargulisbacteria bacterium SCGC AG-410-N11]|nr:glutamine synthetase [Candidatus Marinamargulisbacteria bacterium SCGC AG-410-N11]